MSIEEDMNDEPRQKLCEIVARRKTLEARVGRDILSDPRLCKAYLMDLCGEHKREVNVLTMALEERVAVDLLASRDGVPLEILLGRLTRRLLDHRALTERAARWAVESWALALGLIEQPDTSPAPRSPQPPKPEISRSGDVGGDSPAPFAGGRTEHEEPATPPRPASEPSTNLLSQPRPSSDPRPAKRAQFPAWLWGLIPIAGFLLIGGLGLLVSSLLATARPIAQMTLTPTHQSTRTPTPTRQPTQTPTPQPSPTRYPDVPPADASLGDTWTRPADNAMMVYVPAGEFQMGSMDGYNEQPVHTVSLDGFWIDKHEVTNAQFAAFLNEKGNQTEGGLTWLDLDSDYCLIEQSGGEFRPKPGYADHPVVMVSWYGAKAYAEWVGGRLPSEAEWEYAARGPEGYVYPWGDEFDGTRLNFCDVNCAYDRRATRYDDGYENTAPVGSFPDGASWCGALDMAGNVWEWTRSLYKDYPYDPGDGREDLETDGRRVLRSGSFGHTVNRVRCAYRYRWDPHYHLRHLGFRLVASPFTSGL